MTSVRRRTMGPQQRAVPRLDLSAPLRLGAVAACGVFSLLAITVVTPIVTGPFITVTGRVRAEPALLRHADGGVVNRVAVKEGEDVEAGTVIAVIDTRLIDSQIAGLRRQMDGIQMHVGGLRQEAEALAASDRLSTQRQRLAGLEAQIAASEQESLGLQVRLAMAEQEKTRTTLRAPIAGRIVKIVAHEGASVLPSGVIAELQPAPDRLVLDAALPTAQAREIANGQTVTVWPVGSPPWHASLVGKVDHTSGDTSGTRLRVVVDLAGTELAETGARDVERAFTVQVATGSSSLLTAFLAPLTRVVVAPNPLAKDYK